MVPHLKTANLNTKFRISFLICPVYNIKQVAIKPKGFNDYSRTVITLPLRKGIETNLNITCQETILQQNYIYFKFKDMTVTLKLFS